MSRTRTLLSALAIAATAGVLLAQPAAAHACGGGGGDSPAPLDKNLHSVGHSWYTGDNPDTLGVHLRAPRGFEMTRTPTGQGRFNDVSRTWLLTIDPVHQEAYVVGLMHARERELAGLRDLKIVKDGVTIDSENQRLATVTYRYTNAAGEARLVQTRYVAYAPYPGSHHEGFVEITVAGRPQDRPGLNTIMRTATRTVFVTP